MRFSAVALSLALAAALPPGGTFVDDDGTTHEGSIEAIAADEITLGCNPPENTRFCPDGIVTRGEMAAFLDRALALEPTEDNRFVDDDAHLFEASINRLAAAGITRGCNPPDDDRFCPDRDMTRGEMAAMLSRAFDYPAAEDDPFVDDDGIIFESAIGSLAAAGVTVGCNPPDNDRYCPEDPITRAEMATFLTGALELDPRTPPPRPHPAIEVRSRESWGAAEARTELMSQHTVGQLTVHHAGTQSGTTGPAQFRSWQSWHMGGQGWGDIAYHVLIGIDGTVYQGRNPIYEGDTATSYDTTGHFLVVVEGNFDYERPTQAQLDSLAGVLAWAAVEYEMSPATISGHRDHAATTCPGTHLHAVIESGELAQKVATLIETGGVDLIWP